ncbi:MAG: UPF0182 family protein, partial [Patescibacteria group bacterium]|nr:UPF0182 family protein [Patescibacteria group bacterium]
MPLISTALWSVLVLGIILAIVSFVRHLIAADGYFDDLEENPLDWRVIWTTIAVILAGLAWFGRYSILYSESGVVYGAGYIDVHIWKVFWPVFAVVLLITGVYCLLSKKGGEFLGPGLKVFKQPVLIGAVIVVALIVASMSGFVMWKTNVEMNELNKELPYITDHIEFTRYGFDINDMYEEAYPGIASLNASILEFEAVNNIRIVDYRAVKETLKKNQEIRTYYEFFDIDIDRYCLSGNKTQVLVVPREMNLRELPEKAQTWVNRKLIYTHGYGAVMCPVNQVTKIGEPELLVKDIPSRSMIPGFNITQPRIYYGEGMDMSDYIITNTMQEEFDYPATSEKGDQESNVYCQYSGSGGVVLDTSFKKIIAAMNCDFLNIMLSDDITKDSRLHIYRNTIGRVYWICPYLYWDNDILFLFDDKGKGEWMVMGMPVSNKLPYSMPIDIDNVITINYARDSVKAVVSPLNGDIDFYVTDWDPMMRTYANIYPGIFRDISEMPEGIKAHLKVSEQLYDCRVETANTYHMGPDEFYYKEDVWTVADEIYRGKQRKVESYNVLLPLSGEEEVQFVLQSPQTPRNKKILIAW